MPTKHHSWIGQYIAEQFGGRPNVKLIHTGDGADMPSLSSYDKGKKSMEGRRYKADIRVANAAWDLLNEPIRDWSRKRRRAWKLEKHITLGNHENRINRAIEDDAQLEGVISTDDLNYADWGWKVHPFLEILDLDGIWYSHYFANPMTGHPYGGNIDTRLRNIGHSFTMGHQQGLRVGERYVGPTRHMGLVNGSCLTPDHKVLTADLRYIPWERSRSVRNSSASMKISGATDGEDALSRRVPFLRFESALLRSSR